MCNDTFVNCWHLNQSESVAMWKLYVKDNKGVAIQTTVKNFKSSFEKTIQEIRSGLIQYIDYEKDLYYANSNHRFTLSNGFIAFVHKRDIYRHESEYRAIYHNPKPSSNEGFLIKTDLSRLVTRIIVAPYMSKNDFDTIKNISQKYLNLEPVRSIIEKEPYY